MYYKPEMKCPYRIVDNVLYYTAVCTGKTYTRPMIEEIDRIFNTLRPVALKDGQKRFMKLIYENELVSINEYLINHNIEIFVCRPPYNERPKLDDHCKIMRDKHGHPIMEGQIIRYHGEVPNNNGNKTYYSRECIEYYIEHPSLCNSEMLPEIQQIAERMEHRRQYMKQYARKRYQNKKQSKNSKL